MLPLLPNLSRRSSSLKALRDKGLRGVATVATTFINLNKKKGFRKNFFISSGNSGNQVHCLYIGGRLIKKSCRLDPLQSV
jgi:hypothetical protein